MKSRLIGTTISLALVAALGLSTGCSLFKKKKPAAGTGPGGATQETSVPALKGTDIGSAERPPVGALQRGQFTPVFFEYDSARIKPTEVSKLQAVATYLKSNSSKNLIIEGHCDERGTAEYNRALGERRAQAAREELVRLGVDAGRLSTVSYGNERPLEASHNETAWSKNRRCEFVIAG